MARCSRPGWRRSTRRRTSSSAGSWPTSSSSQARTARHERIRSYWGSIRRVLSGGLLRRLRQRAGLSQAEVARRAGIVPTVLNAYERGRRQPSLEAAGRIIDAMGYEVHVTRPLDAEVQARRLVDALTLAEALPYRPRPLAKARR
ncbi:MAG: helix-turn-helix transcriptional regulator [Actinobacteria bacterium]|nr:helix-turn-helix transcriptional regulator [Actinomycetota bacterium]